MNTEPAFSTLAAIASASVRLIIRCSGAYSLANAITSSSLCRRITRLCASDLCIISCRGRVARSSSITTGSLAANAASVVSRIDWLSGPCSACDRKSLATKRASALPSAIIITSDGPAGISIAAAPRLTCCLASITKRLPGPKILLTRGTLSVPKAMAAMACAPPTL